MKKSYTFNLSNSNNSNNSNNNIRDFDKNEQEFLPGKHIIRNLINFSKSLGVFNSVTIGTFGLINN